jgi:hypothetical protein
MMLAALWDAVKMYEWFDRVGFAVDRAALRREFPDVNFHNFESWAKMQDRSSLLQSAYRPTLEADSAFRRSSAEPSALSLDIRLLCAKKGEFS